MTIQYAWRLVTRNPRRTFTYLFGLALAVGLFAGILFFVDATTRQMTDLALAPVKLDLVAHATTPDVNVIGRRSCDRRPAGHLRCRAGLLSGFCISRQNGRNASLAFGAHVRCFTILPANFRYPAG